MAKQSMYSARFSTPWTKEVEDTIHDHRRKSALRSARKAKEKVDKQKDTNRKAALKDARNSYKKVMSNPASRDRAMSPEDTQATKAKPNPDKPVYEKKNPKTGEYERVSKEEFMKQAEVYNKGGYCPPNKRKGNIDMRKKGMTRMTKDNRKKRA